MRSFILFLFLFGLVELFEPELQEGLLVLVFEHEPIDLPDHGVRSLSGVFCLSQAGEHGQAELVARGLAELLGICLVVLEDHFFLSFGSQLEHRFEPSV
jgi:hypothetical protein